MTRATKRSFPFGTPAPLARLGGRRPLRGRQVVLISHLYDDVFYLLDQLEQAGLEPRRTQVISTAYPFDASVKRQVGERGYPLQAEHAYDEARQYRVVKRALADMARHANGDPILIVDDGGVAARVIAQHFARSKLADGRPLFDIVEVTRNGHRPVDAIARRTAGGTLPFGFSSEAMSDRKRDVLSPAYSSTSLDKAFSAMKQARIPHEPMLGADGPRRVGVIGAGAMGLPAILRLANENYLVTVYEKDPKQRQVLRMARANASVYFVIADDKAEAIRGQHIIVGATGERDVIGPRHLPLLRHGATLFQISSHQRDFDMVGFGAAATSKRRLARGDGLPQRSYTYVFKNVPAAPAPRRPNESFRRFGDGTLANAAGEKEVHFIGDGWTVNHNGTAKGSPFAVVAQELDMIAEQVFAAAERRPPAATGTLSHKSAQSGSVYRTNNYPFRDADGTVRNELLPNQLRKLLDAHERQQQALERSR